MQHKKQSPGALVASASGAGIVQCDGQLLKYAARDLSAIAELSSPPTYRQRPGDLRRLAEWRAARLRLALAESRFDPMEGPHDGS